MARTSRRGSMPASSSSGRRASLARATERTGLREPLERLYRTFDHLHSASDPVHIVRRYDRRDDREIAGFCAAGLAFGRVASVLRSIESLLQVMGSSPAAFVRGFDPSRDLRRLSPLGHRWIRGADIAALMLILQRMLREAGTVERFFLRGDDPSQPDIGTALDRFSQRAIETPLRPVYGRLPARPGVCCFFPRPSSGSACKRLNLFLRWMVRKDAIDLGIWSGLSPARLIVPLDTHVIRLGRCLRLTRYTTPGWKMATEITAALRAVDPADPVRYDFSLCHAGMMNVCGFGRDQADSQCPLRGSCSPETASTKVKGNRR